MLSAALIHQVIIPGHADSRVHEVVYQVDWEERSTRLQAAIQTSEAHSLNTNRAKRLVRELQAYAAAAAALRGLEDTMARIPCGTSQLRAGMMRLEEVGVHLAGGSSSVTLPGAALFAGACSPVSQLTFTSCSEHVLRIGTN